MIYELITITDVHYQNDINDISRMHNFIREKGFLYKFLKDVIDFYMQGNFESEVKLDNLNTNDVKEYSVYIITCNREKYFGDKIDEREFNELATILGKNPDDNKIEFRLNSPDAIIKEMIIYNGIRNFEQSKGIKVDTLRIEQAFNT